MPPRNITFGATQRRLEDLGYAVTSATNPERRESSEWSTGRRLSAWAIRTHEAAILTYPTPFYAPELQDEDAPEQTARKRGIVVMVVTAYLQSDPRQLKAVMSVLDRAKLTSGPVQIDSFGNRLYPVQWNCSEPLLKDRGARCTHPDDDSTVVFKQQAIPPTRHVQGVNMLGFSVNAALDEIGSHILTLDGKWENGHLLDTPRRNLPEVLEDDLREIIGDVERARWGARPAASAKEDA
jgi:hypothetical protein